MKLKGYKTCLREPQNAMSSRRGDSLDHRRYDKLLFANIISRSSFVGLLCLLALLGALSCTAQNFQVHALETRGPHDDESESQNFKTGGADSHNHVHDHEHGHREMPSSEEYDLDSLFPSHINKNDLNVRVVMYACKITRAHLFVKVFDDLMKPLPQLAQALCSTLFISVVPIFLIYGLNSVFMRSKQSREKMTQYLISFAIGGLLGDVFFHTLPHMNSGGHDHHGHGDHHDHQHAHEHDHGHDSHEHGHADEQPHHEHGHSHNPEETLNNLIVVIGIIAFFLIEKFTHSLLGGGHDHGHGGEQQDHGQKSEKKRQKHPKNARVGEKEQEQSAAELEKERNKEIRYQSYAIISMVGDFIHNFTDGLSIGVAYVANYKMGVVTTMAMLFHEIPHEVGDFALLFSLNYSMCGVLGLQLLTACGAMLGTLVGSYAGTLYMNQCLAFTSGGFLYFAINGLMGELKEVQGIFRLTMCICSIFLGLYFMYVFALFE